MSSRSRIQAVIFFFRLLLLLMYQFVVNKFPRHKTLIVCHYASEPWKAVHWLFMLLVACLKTQVLWRVRLKQRWIKLKRTSDSNRTWLNCSVVSGRDNESRAEFCQLWFHEWLLQMVRFTFLSINLTNLNRVPAVELRIAVVLTRPFIFFNWAWTKRTRLWTLLTGTVFGESSLKKY